MRKVLLFLGGFLVLTALPVAAQDVPVPPVAAAMPDGEIVKDPICFNVINQAPYTVFGSFITNYYITADGTRARHRSAFRLEVKQQSQFCAYGPFYEGRKMDMVIRTLVPVFRCRTAITGDITIHGEQQPDGSTKTWADCL